MNKLLEMLVKEAYDYAFLNQAGDTFDTSFQQKLAELVSEECSRIVMQHHVSRNCNEYEDMDRAEQIQDDLVSAISGQILNTFRMENKQ